MLKEFVTKYIKICNAPKFCGKREKWVCFDFVIDNFQYLQQILYTPLLYPAPWLETWSDMNMSCLKQNNAADAVVLQSSKELPPKATQIPRLTKESRLVGRAPAFPFLLNFPLALPLPIYPAHE